VHHLPYASPPIDDFLSGSGGSVGGERWESIGFGIALAGVLVAVGIVVFLARVHAGPRREGRTLVLLANGCGLVMLVGGAVEVAGTAAVLRTGWVDAFTGGSAASAMMRVLAGVLVLIGLDDELAPGRAAGADDASTNTTGTTDTTVGIADTADTADTVDAVDTVDHRWAPGAASAFGVVGVGLGVLSYAFDGHTTTEGPRLLHAAVAVVHVLAAGIWAGGLVVLLVVAALRRRARGAGIAALVVRFSAVATWALVAVVLAGVAMAWMIVDDVGDLAGTDWGRRLVVKVAAVGAAALLGAYNRAVLVPRLASGSVASERTIRTTVALEAVLLAFVVAVTVLLTRAATV
jgi:copper transport protein